MPIYIYYRDISVVDAATKIQAREGGRVSKISRGRALAVRCPAHADNSPSLSVRDGSAAGYLSFHCFAGCSGDTLKTAIMRILGNETPDSQDPPPPRRHLKPVRPEPIAYPHAPQGFEPHPRAFDHYQYGAPSHVWTYRLPADLIAGWIARYDLPGGDKEIIPICWAKDPRFRDDRLVKMGFPLPRPLYNLDKIAGQPDRAVIWSEGEKTADAAQRLFPGWTATTSSGGGNAVELTDWRPLKGRIVIIAPDHDRAGYWTAIKVARLLRKAEVAEVRLLRIPTHRPLCDLHGTLAVEPYKIQHKDDLADHEERGWTGKQMLEAARSAGRSLTRVIWKQN